MNERCEQMAIVKMLKEGKVNTRDVPPIGLDRAHCQVVVECNKLNYQVDRCSRLTMETRRDGGQIIDLVME